MPQRDDFPNSSGSADVTGLPDWRRQLSHWGIAGVDAAYSPEMVSGWNAQLDSLFASKQVDRSYVGVDILASMGIINQFINCEIFSIIFSTIPTARLYHCHVYEIDDGQDRPHIHAEHADGWHRDTETIHWFDANRPRHISLFVYLSDVGPDSGAFELVPQVPMAPPRTGSPAYRALGPAGTTFVWNRSFYHRASPNLSDRRRRVLKLSWQDAELPNDRITTPEFRRAAETVGDDPFLGPLFDPDSSTALATAPTAVPPPAPLPLNSHITIRRSDRLVERVRSLRHQVSA